MTFYCVICKRLTSDVLIMPVRSSWRGLAVCEQCVCEHFDKAIDRARNVNATLYATNEPTKA